MRSVAEIRLERLSAIGRRENNVIDTCRASLRELMRQERDAGGRQHRFRCSECERAQPGAFAADQHNCVDEEASSLGAAGCERRLV
jgi:hypothetical protein